MPPLPVCFSFLNNIHSCSFKQQTAHFVPIPAKEFGAFGQLSFLLCKFIVAHTLLYDFIPVNKFLCVGFMYAKYVARDVRFLHRSHICNC